MNSCNNECHSKKDNNGWLTVLVIYILLAIILGSSYRSSCCMTY